MEHKKRQNTVLDACSEEVQQSTKRGISRRKFVQTSAGVVAAGALLGKRAFAAPRPLKIGYVSPETGALAPFGEADAFVIDEIRKMIQGGIQAGGTTRPVEILVRDSQSSPNRAAEVAAELIKSDKVDLMVVAGTPDTVNPVSDQCEINQMPCVSTDAPWQAYFFGRGGNPAKGFDWTYHFFWGVDLVSQVMCDMFSLVPTNKVVGVPVGERYRGQLFADPVHGHPPVFKARGFKVIDPGRFHDEHHRLLGADIGVQESECRNRVRRYAVADLFELLGPGGAAGLQAEDRHHRQGDAVSVGRRVAGPAREGSVDRGLVVARLSVQVQSHGSERGATLRRVRRVTHRSNGRRRSVSAMPCSRSRSTFSSGRRTRIRRRRLSRRSAPPGSTRS